jgi:hypothetical protein
VIFQATLILSGNLAFLNWLTIVPALACFDDGFLGRLLPKAFGRHAEAAEAGAAAAAKTTRAQVAGAAVTLTRSSSSGFRSRS